MPTNLEVPQPQLETEQYLSRLSPIDRNRLLRISDLFGKVMTETKRNGTLIAIGGTLTKPLPRNDIDLLIVLSGDPSDPQKKDFPNVYAYSLADFEIFKDLVSKMVKKDPTFQIREVHGPLIDIEFDSPNILSHEGAILIASSDKESTPIEFLRDPDRGNYKTVMIANSAPYQPVRPYVLLADIGTVS